MSWPEDVRPLGGRPDALDGRRALAGSALLRAAADDELSAPDEVALRAHLRAHPADRAGIEFERQLRAACGRAMSDAVLTAGLRSRVGAALANAGEGEARADRSGVAGSISGSAGAARRPRWRRVAPIAAALVLASGTLVVVMQQAAPTVAPGPNGAPGDRFRVALAGFLGREHRRCYIDADRARGFAVRELAEVPAAYTGLLGAAPTVADFAGAGLVFIGADRCAVPGRGDSIHMLFETDLKSSRAGSSVSLFIQKDTGDLPLEPGVAYTLDGPARADQATPVINLWRSGGLIYFLVSGDEGPSAQARAAMDVPTPTRAL